MPRKPFRALAVLLGELGKIPDHDAEANRLYRRLRSDARVQKAVSEVQPKQAAVADQERTVRGLRPAGLTSL